MKCVSHKFKPVSYIGYILAVMIALIHLIPEELLYRYSAFMVLSVVAILFMYVVFSDMRINFVDIAITLVGIIYVVGFFAFVALLYGYERDGVVIGKYFVGFLLLATWGSDVFAYLIGRPFGKHTFSKISPKKSIEGCVAGAVSGLVLVLIAGLLFDKCCGFDVNYIILGVIALVLSLLGQIGDFSASCIKRYCEVKDFSHLIPGHGGILDRFDSVIFVAPFAYYLLTLLL